MKHMTISKQMEIEMPIIKLLHLYLEKLEKLTKEERATITRLLNEPPITLVHPYPPVKKLKGKDDK